MPRFRTLISVARCALLTAALCARPTSVAAQAQAPTTLTLGGAARLAAERGSATAVARARSVQADARVTQRRAELLPTIKTSSQISTRTFNSASLGIDIPAPGGGVPVFDPRGEVLGPIHNTDMRTQLTQSVIDLPSVWSWRSAAIEADAARFATTAASESAAERGATAYLRVVRAGARISARIADSALAIELLDIARQQLQAGVGIALDVTRAEARLADANARLIAMRSDRDRAVIELRHELTLASDAAVELSDGLSDPSDEVVQSAGEEILRGALTKRADFQEALALSASARAQAKSARAERLPVVSVFADHGTTGKSVDRLLGTYSFGVQVSTPVFDGFRRTARSAERQGKQREAEARVEDSRRRIETEVNSALVTLRSAREEVTAARARLRLAEQEVAQARELFRNGVSGSSDVINASIALNSARELEIESLTNYHLARIALASAQGTVTSLQ